MLEKYAMKYGYTVDVVEKAYYKDREISDTYIRNFFSMEMFLLQMSFWGIRMRSPALWNMDSDLEEHLDFRQ